MKKVSNWFVAITMLSNLSLNAQVQIGGDINGEAPNDGSGISISMPDAYTVAIGANGNDGNGNRSGHVRVYMWNGTAWVQKGMDIDGESAEDWSGWSVSMPDANTVAIGALGGTGQVKVYSWSVTGWVQKGLDIDALTVNDGGGYSVSMPDATTLAIGRRINAGRVRIYSLSNIGITEIGLGAFLKLYPNPASSTLYIEVGSESFNEEYSIYDAIGRKVLSGTLNSKLTTVDIGTLEAGVYTFSDGTNIQQKFILNF